MDKKELSKLNSQLVGKISELLSESRKQVVRSVNQTMVLTYFEIGRLIVEDEQEGKERAEYGKAVLKELSTKLSSEFGKGFSVYNLERMRRFYLLYIDRIVGNEISATVMRKLDNEKSATLLRKSEKPFKLSW